MAMMYKCSIICEAYNYNCTVLCCERSCEQRLFNVERQALLTIYFREFYFTRTKMKGHVFKSSRVDWWKTKKTDVGE